MTLSQEKSNHFFSHKVSGLIWKVQTNERNSLLAIESRNFELKQAAFSVLNFENGTVHFKEKVFEEPWNLTLRFIDEENLILSRQEQANSPESKGILSVSIYGGDVTWERYNLSLDAVAAKGLRVFDPKINPRRYSWLDPLNGETIAEPKNIDMDLSTISFPKKHNQSVLPDSILGVEIVGEIFSMTHKDHLIMSFHEKIKDKIQQRILVYQEDSILHDNILIKDIQKLQPESFFIQKNHLFYIKNKNEIVSFLL